MFAEGGGSDNDQKNGSVIDENNSCEFSGEESEESDEEKSIKKFLSPLREYKPRQIDLMKKYYLSGIDRPKVL